MNEGKGVSRRKFLAGSVAVASTWELQRAAWALGMGPDANVCKLLPEQEVGPYYVADELLRADIREGKPGLPLTLRIAVLDSRTCKPLPNAAIDIWHCDALGIYSGYTKMDPTGFGGPGGPGGPPPGDSTEGPPGGPPPGFDPNHPENHPGPPEGFGPPPENHPTDKMTFLRGVQMTGPDGAVTFRTVFPGFYMGRTNHIHFKVRLGGHAGSENGMPGSGTTYLAGHTSHVGQVFFPEEMAAELMRHEPYAKHAIHRTTQTEDGVFTNQYGELSMATLRPSVPGKRAVGFTAHLVAAVEPSATRAPAQRMGGPGGLDRSR